MCASLQKGPRITEFKIMVIIEILVSLIVCILPGRVFPLVYSE